VHYSHQSHMNTEVQYDTFLLLWHVNWLFFSAHLIKWITENNWSVNIVNDWDDWELCKLLTAGWPQIELSSHITVFQDIKACFAKCHNHITKLLHVPIHLHFYFWSELIPYYL
jgi:hypothetical protein